MSSYISPVYEAIGPVSAFHAVPRFGSISDLTELFSADGLIIRENVVSYAFGSIFVGAFLLATYFIFLLLIFIFKCCCRGNKSRILAGSPFIDVVYDETQKTSKTLKALRGMLFFSSVVIVVSGLVFLVKGTQQFQAVADDVLDVTQGFIGLAEKVASTSDSFISFSEESEQLRDSLQVLIDQGICGSFQGGNGNVLDEFDTPANALNDALGALQEFAQTDVTEIKETFQSNMESAVNDVEDIVEVYESSTNAAYYAGPAIAFGLLFMIGIVLASMNSKFKLYFLLQTWLFLPLFFIFFTVSILIIVVVGIALVANADVCIGNPSSSPEGFVDSLSKQFLDGPTQQAVDYYLVTGCRGDYLQLLGVEDTMAELTDAIGQVDDLIDILKDKQGDFEVFCGGQPGDLNDFATTLNSTAVVFEEVENVGQNAIDLLNCEDINRIWIDLMHDAVCTSSPYALAYMFGTMTAIYVVGMFIFLLRGALLPEVAAMEVEEDGSVPKDKDGNDTTDVVMY